VVVSTRSIPEAVASITPRLHANLAGVARKARFRSLGRSGVGLERPEALAQHQPGIMTPAGQGACGFEFEGLGAGGGLPSVFVHRLASSGG